MIWDCAIEVGTGRIFGNPQLATRMKKWLVSVFQSMLASVPLELNQ
jgi:hypothetical protein